MLAASSVLAVGAAEWGIRRYLPQEGLIYRLDPRYHYSLAPKARKLSGTHPRTEATACS